jgi:hypothetical protein
VSIVLAVVAGWVAQAPAAAPVVTVAQAGEPVLRPGASSDARLEVTVKEGFHVQSNPAAEPYLVPVTLDLGADDRLKLGKPVYPPGKAFRLPGADDDLLVYDGTFELRVPIDVSAGAAPGVVRIEGTLRYQACDDRVCLRPASIPVGLTVKIARPE